LGLGLGLGLGSGFRIGLGGGLERSRLAMSAMVAVSSLAVTGSEKTSSKGTWLGLG
jgi:hypothetical protein